MCVAKQFRIGKVKNSARLCQCSSIRDLYHLLVKAWTCSEVSIESLARPYCTISCCSQQCPRSHFAAKQLFQRLPFEYAT